MVECPKCGAEIHRLDYYMKVSEFGKLHPSGDLDCKGTDASEDEEYSCPVCGEVLYTDYVEAVAFLDG